ncbi:VanZ family protein [Streptomyces sp. HNM0574]|uniref:VanZ family protein n=1 Tax=Streptomyces sp. HNM0574 TaxID=2714954 RepID=UPI00146C5B7F|nr:VanZ family protein [Streptomyces sp. HNM0574]NLU66756.1 hypothetical protein [Streptomyces sp. HNM0574]
MPTPTHSAVMAALTLLLTVAAVLAHRPLARRTGRSPRTTLALTLALALCLGLTLPDQLAPGVTDRLTACLTGNSHRTLTGGPAHNAVNILLWLPVGLLGTLTTRRPLMVALTGSALWALVELLQTLDPTRSCQPLDWANNTAGVGVGVVVGWVVCRGRPGARAAAITSPNDP